jgi:hypothetical protein
MMLRDDLHTLSAQEVAMMRVIRGSCCAKVATGSNFSTYSED